jgi:hypothetical protein
MNNYCLKQVSFIPLDASDCGRRRVQPHCELGKRRVGQRRHVEGKEEVSQQYPTLSSFSFSISTYPCKFMLYYMLM